MTDTKTAMVGAAIGLAGGIGLGGLLWWLWFGGQGLPPDDVRGRVISFTGMTGLFTTLANMIVALLVRSLLHGDSSPALSLHGALWGGLLGCLGGAFLGFCGHVLRVSCRWRNVDFRSCSDGDCLRANRDRVGRGDRVLPRWSDQILIGMR